ncbi:MAG: CDP-archaeol synthase [Ruminococcus sp.]|nr:CDP-archaeol synthase [Ruminococcus sp.]
MNSLKPRLMTAAVGIPVAVIVMLLTELWRPLAGIIVGIAAAVMILEYLNARRLTACIPLTVACVAFALFTPMLVTTNLWYVAAVLYMSGVSCVLIYQHKKLSYASFTYAVFGTVLITFGMSAFVVAVNNEVSASFFFALMLLLPWMADGGGYFVGSKFGKRKLCPNISPKKTIEGAVGGLMFCLIAALIMGLVFQLWIIRDYKINFVSIIIIALLDASASILGDITFSLIKRHLNIKDYGSLFPGHGGVLDRFDSIVFTAPLAVAVNSIIPFFIEV